MIIAVYTKLRIGSDKRLKDVAKEQGIDIL
jgi:hypothetical protein